MASHRKLHPPVTHATGPSAPAPAPVPVPAGPAPASVALLPHSAEPSDVLSPGGRPSPEEVERKLDELYRRADAAADGREESEGRNGGSGNGRDEDGRGGAGSRYGGAEEGPGGAGAGVRAGERGVRQRGRGGALRDGTAKRTDMLTKAREMLGAFTAAPYRPAASGPDAAALLLAEAPSGYFDRAQLMSRLTARQRVRAAGRTAQRPAAAGQNPSAGRNAPVDAVVPGTAGPGTEGSGRHRASAGASVMASAGASTTASAAQQYDIRAAKAAVQRKLAAARTLLVAAGTATGAPATAAPVPAVPSAPVVPAVPTAADGSVRRVGSPSVTKALKALAFARAQIGKPYVWGASGPGSYDCSGLTQAAWKAAGVALPRSTRDQSDAGTTVPLAEALPGDLVFFHDPHDSLREVGHVGVYAGHGMMIHAPGPGAYVREDPIHHDGAPAVHHVVRPA
ncbi:C40 family peptidase [Streptomyces sp. NPDC093260]|uniref:C40 family peptidase n=1 Tax=Streptomyces sp. NPDC093260 TaxID=3155073 RepID=UPI00341CF6A5